MEKIFNETYLTEIGKIAIYATESKIIKIEYVENVVNTNNGSKLTDKAAFEINDFAHGRIKSFTFPYEMKGTEFQKKVWQALLEYVLKKWLLFPCHHKHNHLNKALVLAQCSLWGFWPQGIAK